MCQSTSLVEAAIVGCSRSILSARHLLRSSTKKRLNHPRPRWCRRDSTGKKMADRYPEMWKLSSCELGQARMVVRTRRYFSSWHQAHGSAGRAIAHWRDASTEMTIIVVPNSSWCLLCTMLKIAFYTKNRTAPPNCAQADVTVTSCFCNERFAHLV